MKKAIFSAPFHVAYEEVKIPEISEEQVLLKVMNVGICGSDLHTYRGEHPTRNKFPLDFGHEVAGMIVKAGASVTDYQVGDRVTVEPQKYCGVCQPCREGRINICEHAKGSSVFCTEYAAVDSYMLHRCPEDMPYEQNALVEPLAVAVASVKHCHYRDARICVVGAGTIGNLTAQAAMRMGAADIMITDILDSKLAYARRCGIPHCVNTGGQSLKQAIEDSFGARGADVIIDAAAAVKGFYQILDACRDGSEIVITGSYHEPVTMELTRLQRHEVSLLGHFMYVRSDFRDAIEMLSRHEIYIEDFISARYPLLQTDQAIRFVDERRGEPLKVMIEVGTSVLDQDEKEDM